MKTNTKPTIGTTTTEKENEQIVGVTFNSKGTVAHNSFWYGQDGFTCWCCKRLVYEYTDYPWPDGCSDCSGERYDTCPRKFDDCTSVDGVCARKDCRGWSHCCIREGHDIDKKMMFKKAGWTQADWDKFIKERQEETVYDAR